MAAAPAAPYEFETAELKLFRGAHLQPLLEEQQAYWSKHFRWDFSPSKNLIMRYLDMRSLNGSVLMKAGRPIGYSFFIHEERKALIGDLFLSDEYRNEPRERFLFETILKLAAAHPGVRRIEGQLLALSFAPENEVVYGSPLKIFRRLFMLTEDFDRLLEPRATEPYLQYKRWAGHYLDPAARLIARAYGSHVDSHINDQYRSYAGARRFLYNTSQHPGCGTFCRQAALAAIYTPSREVCAVCLASLVEPRVGHVTQLCVAPHMSGQGVGYESLRRSLGAFRELDCEAVSLTVTESNEPAVRLYERVGFRTIRRFHAFVWEADGRFKQKSATLQAF